MKKPIKVLSRLFSWPTLLSLDEAHAESVLRKAFLFLFAASTTMADMKDLEHTFATLDVSEFQDSLPNNGRLMKNFKLYCHAFSYDPNISPSAYGLTKDEAQAAQWLLSPANLKLLKGFTRRGYPPVSIAQYDAFLADVLNSPELSTFLGKFVWKKMTFLVNSYGTTYEDLAEELRMKCYPNLLRCYPRYESRLHAINICKQVSHNLGINMILAHTAKSRNALFANSDGTFSSRVVHVEAFDDNSPGMSANLLEDPDSARRLEQVENKHAISELLAKLESKPNTRRFLRLLLGYYDAEFSAFLERNNEDYAESVSFPALLRSVCAFWNLPEQQGKKILADCKKMLS